MTITAQTLIQDALLDVGAIGDGEAMSAAQAAHGLRSLNRIIDGWRARRLYVYALTNVQASFSGATATVGASLTVNTEAPLRFEPGCYFVIDGESYPLPEWTIEQYNSIGSKTDGSTHPQGFYFDRKVPGTVTVWPVPASTVEYHFMVMQKISKFADLSTEYALPDGYEDALHYTLCERLPTAYQLPVDPMNAAAARAARDRIRRNNVRVPVLSVGLEESPYHNILNG